MFLNPSLYNPEELYFVNKKNNSASFEVNFQKILAPHLTIGKHDKATASAYIEIYDDKFFMITGNGFVSKLELYTFTYINLTPLAIICCIIIGLT